MKRVFVGLSGNRSKPPEPMGSDEQSRRNMMMTQAANRNGKSYVATAAPQRSQCRGRLVVGRMGAAPRRVGGMAELLRGMGRRPEGGWTSRPPE